MHHYDGDLVHREFTDFAKLSYRRICPLVVEVSDYLPVGYAGPLTPGPPHADLNPNHTAIVTWEGMPH